MSSFRGKFMPSSLDEQTAEMLADLEQWERRRTGSIETARRSVARRIGLTEGALERVRRKRLKGVKGYVIERIRAAFVPALVAERIRLARALDLVEGRRLNLAGDAAREAGALLHDAQRLIDEAQRLTGETKGKAS